MSARPSSASAPVGQRQLHVVETQRPHRASLADSTPWTIRCSTRPSARPSPTSTPCPSGRSAARPTSTRSGTALGAPLTDEGDGNHDRPPGPRRRHRGRASWPLPGPATSGSSTAARCRSPLAADWLVSAWDQNAAMHVMTPRRGRHRGGRPRVAARAPAACPPGVRGPSSPARQMANVVGPDGRPPPGARAGRLGRRGRRPVRCAAGHRRRGRRAPCRRRPGPALPRLRHRRCRRRLAVDDQGALDPSDLARVLGEPTAGRRSSAPRRAT